MPTCGRGCGESTGGETFRPGHDQKLRTLEGRAGGLISLSTLVDAAERYNAAQLPVESPGEVARRVALSRT